jgi:hypothetical protein
VKDFVNAPAQKYEDMYNVISKEKKTESVNIDNSTSSILSLPKGEDEEVDLENMKFELKNHIESNCKKRDISELFNMLS